MKARTRKAPSGPNAFGYVTEQVLADMLGRSVPSLAEDRKRGRQKVPFLRYGARVLYRVAAVEKYLLSLEQEPLVAQTPLRRVIHKAVRS